MAKKQKQSTTMQNILAGVGFGAPIMLTIWLFATIVLKTDMAVIGQLVNGEVVGGLPKPLNPGTYAPVLYEFPGVGLIVLTAVLYIGGAFLRSWLGNKIKNLVNYVIEQVPLVGSAFKMIKKVIDQVAAQEENAVEKKAVMVEHLRDDAFAPAFSLGYSTMFLHPRTLERLLVVYFPSAPNPTSGWIILLPESLVHECEYGADSQMEFILSCGFSQSQIKSVLEGYAVQEAHIGTGQIVTKDGVVEVSDFDTVEEEQAAEQEAALVSETTMVVTTTEPVASGDFTEKLPTTEITTVTLDNDVSEQLAIRSKD